MELKKLLEKNKTAIHKKWIDSVFKTYAQDTSRFLKTNKDQFSNPVGSTLSSGLPAIFDELVNGPDRETVLSFLDRGEEQGLQSIQKGRIDRGDPGGRRGS